MRACTASPTGLVRDRTGSEPVPGYRLLERIGFGGAGEVWSAEAPGGLRVALKIVGLVGGLGQRERNSLRILRAIRHPNLLAYFGAWQSDDRLIIGMELADRSLWDRYMEATRQGLAGIPLGELLEVLREAARVIDFVNEPRHQLEGRSGVAIRHRDIKPQNIMLIGRGVKVADFGLSCLSDQSGASRPTAGLTFAYAAPEVFRRQTSAASDQYSLAVTYCQLRAGRLPFAGSPAAVMHGHLFGAPNLSLLPEPERPIIARALAKEPSARWPSCQAFVQALAEAARGSPDTIAALWADVLDDASDSGSVLVPPLSEPGDWSGPVSAESVSVDAASVSGRGPVPVPGLPEAAHPVAGETSCMPTMVVPTTADLRDTRRVPRAILVAVSILAAGVAIWSWKIAGRAAATSLRADPVVQLRAREPIPRDRAPGRPAPASAAARSSSRRIPPSGPGVTVRPPIPPPPPFRPSKPPEPRIAGGSPARLSSLDRTLELWTPLIRRAWAVSYDWISHHVCARRRPPEPGAGTLAAKAQRRPEVSAAESAADLRLTLPETLRLAAGRSVPVPIEVTRGGFNGPVSIHFEGLPAGISLPDLTIPAGRNQAEARAVARPDAAVGQVPVTLLARAGTWHAEATIRLEVGPRPARELESRGFTLLACGRPAEAVAALTRAMEAGASDPTLYHNRGAGYSLLNQLDRALADYSEAIRLDPGNARAYEARARVYLKRGDVARYQADIERVAELTQAAARAPLPPPDPSPPPPHHPTGTEPSTGTRSGTPAKAPSHTQNAPRNQVSSRHLESS